MEEKENNSVAETVVIYKETSKRVSHRKGKHFGQTYR